jgi:hypothetical protein
MKWPWRGAKPAPNPPKGYAASGKKIGRPTNEKLAAKRRDALLDAKTRLELAKLTNELRELEHPTETVLDVPTIERVVKFLRDNLDMIVVPRRGGRPIDEGGPLREVLEVVKAAAPLVQPLVQQAFRPTAGAIAPPSTLAAPPAPTPPAPAAPPVAPALPAAGPGAELPWQLRMLLDRLGGMDPTAAAAWIAQQEQPPIRQWAITLADTPPDQLWPRLDQIAGQADPSTGQPSPNVVGVVLWLRARPRWTEAVAAALAAARTSSSTAQNGASPPDGAPVF